jgi:hypothetical protein
VPNIEKVTHQFDDTVFQKFFNPKRVEEAVDLRCAVPQGNRWPTVFIEAAVRSRLRLQDLCIAMSLAMSTELETARSSLLYEFTTAREEEFHLERVKQEWVKMLSTEGAEPDHSDISSPPLSPNNAALINNISGQIQESIQEMIKGSQRSPRRGSPGGPRGRDGQGLREDPRTCAKILT